MFGGYFFHFDPVWRALPEIGAATWVAVQVAAVSMTLALLIGIVAALAHHSGSKTVRGCVVAYVEAMRNSPSLVKMYFIYFGLPSLGLFPSPFWSGVCALALHNGGYMTEIIRGGLASVNDTQVQAARSLGMSWWRTHRTIVLPQALRNALPALVNVWVEMIKDTSLTSALSVRELYYEMTALNSATLRTFEILIVFSAIYLTMTTLFSFSMKVVEGRTKWR